MAKKDAPEATAEKKPAVEKIEQNGVVRPKAGTKTGRVWEISDAISAEGKAPAPRKDVIEACVKEEINASTAATQYGRWRKFNGLEGRAAKPETAATE